MHEIGHAVGLVHEQQRRDRNSFVRILTKNIEEDRKGNFRMYPERSGMDVGSYDYDSIMHYGARAFGIQDSAGRRRTTVQPKRPGASIGQRFALNRGDVNTVFHIYVSPDSPRPPRLRIGDRALLRDDTSANNVRREPRLDNNVMERKILPGQELEIVSGPTYADGYHWWHVRSEQAQVRGWTAEGGSETEVPASERRYWLVPVRQSAD
jgi:hypothetical protein